MESAGSSAWNRAEASLDTRPPNVTSNAAISTPLTAQSASRSASLLFIDSRVQDYQSLLAGVRLGTEVYVLDSTDAVASQFPGGVITQITQTLMGRSNISSLHILSHGATGSLELGNDRVDLGDLNRHADQLQSWASALTEDADILLYGCDVAEGEIGQAFVQQLAKLTSADVTASDDLTGNSALGGDWNLELATGKIETPLTFKTETLTSYSHILANAGDVIINEFSQGSGGGKEWVEILVVVNNLNLQNHRLIDSNGSLDIKLSGAGFASLKAGTLIVVYNGADIDGTITPDLTYNPAIGDYSLQISSQNTIGAFAITFANAWSATGAFANGSATDVPRLVNESGTTIYTLARSSIATGNSTAYQSDSTSGATNANNWSPNTISTLATPGVANGGSNTTWINSLCGNLAPVLNTTGNPTLPSIQQGASNPIGMRVVDLIASLGGTGITDADFGALKGIAITGADNTNGTWQFSTNSGTNWTNLGTVSDNAATLLGATPLYTPQLGNAINNQSWLSFNNLRSSSGTILPGSSTQSAGTSGTRLNTTGDIRNYAGYTNYQVNPDLSQSLKNPAFPVLDRTSGYSLSFNLQVLQESHTNNDRGFAVTLLDKDTLGIELGFQFDGTNGRIFAQNLNAQNQFVGAESITFNTNALTAYKLTIQGNTYQLFANGTQVLTGGLRNYATWTSSDGFPSPYTLPNFVFLGDNTTSAQGIFNVGQIALQTDTRIRFVPNATYAGNSQISFRAWDGATGGSNGQASVNVTNNGGATAFSTAVETATIAITSIRPDLLWHNINTGATGFWKMSGMSFDSYVNIFNVRPEWKMEGSGDFDRDGDLDILWRNSSNGEVGFWKMKGMSFESYIPILNVGSGWQVEATGDFDRDGDLDILWRNGSNGEVGFWKMKDMSYQSYHFVSNVSSGWKITSTGDFDRDGDLDILWCNSSSGEVGFWKMNGMSYQSYVHISTVTLGWSIGGTGDFDGDGNLDILWSNSNTGATGFWKMNGMSYGSYVSTSNVGINWQIKGVADFDNDGKLDILWQNSSTGATGFWKMNNMSFDSYVHISYVDPGWQLEEVGDFEHL
ncbi:DUF4347 domain-containing protein [Phormidesmis priestleyi]